MEIKQDLRGLKELLPHGSITEIAKRAGVLTPTVSRALKGDITCPKLPEIMKATAELLAEYKTREREAIQALSEALKQK